MTRYQYWQTYCLRCKKEKYCQDNDRCTNCPRFKNIGCECEVIRNKNAQKNKICKDFEERQNNEKI